MNFLETSPRRALLALALALTFAPALAAPTRPVKIQLFGDSTQYGFDRKTGRPVPHPPVQVLQAAMDSRFGRGAVVVTERAVPGTTSGELLLGQDGRNRPWPAEVDADIVVVNHALNDSREQVPLATYAANLSRLHATVYETPNPVTVPWNSPPYASAMRTVAAQLKAPVADVDAWMRAQPDWPAMLADGVHPTDAAYGAIVRNVLMPTLEPLVAAKLAKR